MEDQQLIKGLQQGEEAALCAVIDCYGAYIGTIICNLSRGFLSEEDAEEIAADVFAGLWRNAQSLRAPLKPYLAQAARNMTRSRLRGRQEILPLEECVPAGDAPEDETILREQSQIINNAVAQMDEPDREIFIRFYFFGERLKGIARRLGLKLPTAKTKLRRAREKLRQNLEERGYGREKA